MNFEAIPRGINFRHSLNFSILLFRMENNHTGNSFLFFIHFEVVGCHKLLFFSSTTSKSFHFALFCIAFFFFPSPELTIQLKNCESKILEKFQLTDVSAIVCESYRQCNLPRAPFSLIVFRKIFADAKNNQHAHCSRYCE